MNIVKPEKGWRPPGGHVTDVEIVKGDAITVRRPMGPWSSSVDELLRHLDRKGFEGAPRALGYDEGGRQVLSYIDGDVPIAGQPPPIDIWTDDVLHQVMTLLGRLHEATKDFEQPPAAKWGPLAVERWGSVVCHNDIAPWNTVFRDGRPVAFIDWDLAGPGTPEWDIAYAAWRWVPLYESQNCPPQSTGPASQARRLALMAEAFGMSDTRGFIDLIEERQLSTFSDIEMLADAGHPAYQNLFRQAGPRIRRETRLLREHRSSWAAGSRCGR